MANNYLQPVNDHFGFSNTRLDDVDDDIFLNHSRSRTPLSEQGAVGGIGRSTNPFDEDPEEYQRQILEERRRHIEARSLESTQKSLGLLYETEEVGKATAVELAKQREQLERTTKQLDDINASLRFSQRHLNGLKSVFGGLKNYLSGNREQQPPANAAAAATTSRSPSGSQISQMADYSKPTNSMSNIVQHPKSPTEKYDNHPITRLRDDSSMQQQRMQQQHQRRNNPFEAQLEANLEEMCGNLSRLKGLATDLGQEIESQNELLDNMNYKMEDVDIKLSKQNKDIYKLLGNK
ncbi:synaptosomal-associated protein 29 [Calliphora vicina]|uniref:synaptosomal-associated protein 29 n=1 Tax=Calliphora vicina TaxID=7373 RepID=UPI00325A73FB